MLGERCRLMLATAAVGVLAAGAAHADDGPSFEIYGAAQADYIQDFNRVHPAWDDALRPSRIPTVEGLYGDDGQSIISARQSRFGLKAVQPIAGKDLEVKFEFDLFGTGDDEGQTTIHLQHFYGRWGPLLAGQTSSVFMDGDIFPNTIDYWGPSGMAYLRTPQVRFTHKTGPHEFAVAIEKPSNDIDPGNVRLIDPRLGSSIQGDEKAPDLTAHYRYDGGWGHVQLAGILRSVGFETADTPNNEPKDSKTGWGFNLTSNVKIGAKDVLHLGVVYGEGIASYMNDGGVDLAPEIVAGPVQPVALRPDVVPLLGLTIYYDHYWNDQWSSAIGWSQTKVENTSFQSGDAFESGQYASVNLLYTPAKPLLMGVEFLWGRREDFDGAEGEDARLQFSFKYSFSSKDFR